jgi:vancomycin permeability regulator SanA
MAAPDLYFGRLAVEKINKRIVKRCFIVLICICAAICAAALILNAVVKSSAKDRIVTADEARELDADCILVLGAGVKADGSPSDMLRDRMLTAIELYDGGVSDRLLVSGDHGSDDYDEVNTMKGFAVDSGVPSECVFMDHAGFSTYDSIYRAKEVFCADTVVIVTQEYHLYRALYIAEKLGINAVGVPADKNEYRGQLMRDVREILARDKDFFSCIIKPLPKYLGDEIPVSSNGDLTNDREA